jgi:hypothetical protein
VIQIHGNGNSFLGPMACLFSLMTLRPEFWHRDPPSAPIARVISRGIHGIQTYASRKRSACFFLERELQWQRTHLNCCSIMKRAMNHICHKIPTSMTENLYGSFEVCAQISVQIGGACLDGASTALRRGCKWELAGQSRRRVPKGR